MSRARSLTTLAVAGLILALAACSDSSSSVTPLGPPTISVTASGSEFQIGQVVHFDAQVRNSRGNLVESAQVQWSTSDPTIVMVDPVTGVGRAESEGVAQITAASEGATGSTSVTVLPPPIESVTVVGIFRIKAGESQEFEVIQELADGTVVHRPVTWATSDPSIATASASGVVVAHQPGEVQLVLTIDGEEWDTTLTVFDWVHVDSDGYRFTWIESQIPVENRFGQEHLPQLVFGCDTATGFFALWVSVQGFVTASGLVVYALDDEEIESATWIEGNDFNVLFHPGSTNLQRKNFATRIAGATRFGFGFGEFNAEARATIFRVAGLQPHLAPLLAGCPSNAVVDDAIPEAATLAPGGTVLAAWSEVRSSYGPAAPPTPELVTDRSMRRAIGPELAGAHHGPERLEDTFERILTPEVVPGVRLLERRVRR